MQLGDMGSIVETEPDLKKTSYVTGGVLINEKTYDKRMIYGMGTGFGFTYFLL
jgi:hypothetical protein